MSTDLENDLRDALRARAATITRERLRGPSPARRAPRFPVAAWVAAAALVLAAIVGIGLAVTGGDGHGRSPADGGGLPDLRGTAWSVRAVTVDGKRQPITSAGVYVVFHLDHRFDASDGVNFYSSRWRQQGDTVVLGDVAGTLVGYGGHDPAVLAAQRAIGALQGTVPASFAHGVLTLSPGNVRLELTRRSLDPGFSGATTEPSARVSQTGTPTGGAPHSYVNGSELAPSAS